jgi:hypothetical protein
LGLVHQQTTVSTVFDGDGRDSANEEVARWLPNHYAHAIGMVRSFTLVCAVVTVASGGCGDAIECGPADVIVIRSPGESVEVDGDPVLAGIQADVEVRTTLGEGTDVGLVATVGGAVVATGAAIVDAEGDATFEGVTLPSGSVRLEVTGEDECGTVTDGIDVEVFSADAIAISFFPPADDGSVGRADGVVVGDSLQLELCGNVDVANASVTVAVDGGAEMQANVTSLMWCQDLELEEAGTPHAIVVNAATANRQGTATLGLTVDLTGPDAIGDLGAAVVNHQRLTVTWTAPGERGDPAVGYIAKVATSPITEGNFDAIGDELDVGTPGAPGSAESVDVFPARTGTAFWVAIAATDAEGNRAAAAIAGPVTPQLTPTGALTAGDPTNANLLFGSGLTTGRFNDDELVDVAVGAPGERVGGLTAAGTVSVYFGTPAGISATPDVVLHGDVLGARFGSSMTAVRWSSATRDDLVVGAPRDDGGDGRLYVFHGGAGFGATDAADAEIGVATTPGWFAASNLGSALARGRIDADAIDDLVIGAPAGGGGRGGIVIVYGGTVAASETLLSDVDAGPAAGAVATLIEDPAATTGQRFGISTHVVGPTEGAGDATDDVVVGYVDDGVPGDAAYVFRPDGSRPPAPGVTQSGFVLGRDVRIEYVSSYANTGFATQATTIPDENGDGARELVIGAYRAAAMGAVLVIDGDTMGTGGVASTGDAGVVLTTITGGASTVRLGAAIAGGTTGVGAAEADLDGDGEEDLMIAAVTGGTARLYVWFGGELPAGATTVNSAGYGITGPSGFALVGPSNGVGPAALARWAGDVDGDGVGDVCWSAPNDFARDGAFELLHD